MKHFHRAVTLCLFILALLFWIDSTTKYEEFIQKTEAELKAKDLRIDKLEKEIRIMHTDLDIAINGFEK